MLCAVRAASVSPTRFFGTGQLRGKHGAGGKERKGKEREGKERKGGKRHCGALFVSLLLTTMVVKELYLAACLFTFLRRHTHARAPFLAHSGSSVGELIGHTKVANSIDVKMVRMAGGKRKEEITSHLHTPPSLTHSPMDECHSPHPPIPSSLTHTHAHTHAHAHTHTHTHTHHTTSLPVAPLPRCDGFGRRTRWVLCGPAV